MAFPELKYFIALKIFSLLGSVPSILPGKTRNVLRFDLRTSLSSWLTVVANGRSAPRKTSTLALSEPETFGPDGKSGPMITIVPDLSLKSGGFFEPPGTKTLRASCPTKAGVFMNLSTNSSHCDLVDSISFAKRGIFPVT